MKSSVVGLLLLAACAPPALLPPAKQLELTFDRYTPLSTNAEMARRTLSPLTSNRIVEMKARGATLREQPIELEKEKFAVYVPAGPQPPAGYGLLVFIAPWAELTRPNVWRPALDRRGFILVSAENSGNDAKVLDRRLPLALLAYENVRARYPVDPERIYVGGFSGGSRAAEIAALAYPDVFRGALLNAGSDPIGGEQGIYLPPAELFRKFQRSRLVFVTGERDDLNLRDDERSRASLRDHCVFDVEVAIARRLGHEALDRPSLERALVALDQRSQIDAGQAEQCNAALQAALTAQLSEAEAAIARGDREGARSLLKSIDARYAGLAGPALTELQRKLAQEPR
jgi:predicted esterase